MYADFKKDYVSARARTQNVQAPLDKNEIQNRIPGLLRKREISENMSKLEEHEDPCQLLILADGASSQPRSRELFISSYESGE